MTNYTIYHRKGGRWGKGRSRHTTVEASSIKGAAQKAIRVGIQKDDIEGIKRHSSAKREYETHWIV